MYQYTTEKAFTLESMPELILDPDTALGLSDQYTGRVESTEESVPKEEKPYIVKVLSCKYNMRVPFDTRMGLKKIIALKSKLKERK